MRRAVAVLVVTLLSVHAAATPAPQATPATQAPPVTQAQQRPVFRGGTHFVRVDAYPLQDGRIVEGLDAKDFEVFEDGQPQAIESFDFVKFDTFTPDPERRDPATQQEGFDLASDPRNRVFVIYVDMAFSQAAGAFKPTVSLNYIAEPLAGFLDRILTRTDLYAFLTSRNSVKDLVLQRKTTVTREQISDLWRSAHIDKDDADPLFQCGCGKIDGPACDAMIEELKARYRADMTYNNLDELVRHLGTIRQERKSVILVSDLLPRWRPNSKILELRGPVLPPIGSANGRPTIGTRQTGAGDESYCATEFQRLALLDLDPRYKDLLREARKQNVAFYPITPGGLQAPVGIVGIRAAQNATDDFRTLADETDGIAVVNTNDLTTGIKRIADDMAAYYVLGYYTTNMKWDGGLRNIKVRLKSNGKDIRARRQYRAPTQEEINALASGAASSSASSAGNASNVSPAAAIQSAFGVLDRAASARNLAAYAAVSGKAVTVVAELPPAVVAEGKWKDGGAVEATATTAAGDTVGTARATLAAGARSIVIRVPLSGGAWPDRVSLKLHGDGRAAADEWVKVGPSGGTLIGEPIAYRIAPRMADSAVAALEFARNERIRLEWPVLAKIENRQIRLLDRTGKPFPVDVPLAEDQSSGEPRLIAQLPLAALRGDYLIELTASAGGVTDRRLVAVRVR